VRIPVEVGHRFRRQVGHWFRWDVGHQFRQPVGHRFRWDVGPLFGLERNAGFSYRNGGLTGERNEAV